MDVDDAGPEPRLDAGPTADHPRGGPEPSLCGGGAADRPDGAADPGASVPAQHGARCSQCHAAAAVRGQGAGRRAQRPHRADRRHGVRPVERLRRAHPHADGGTPGQQRAALQPLPHHGALLADPRGAADRPQPSREQHRLDHGDRHRLSRTDRPAPQQRGAAGRDAAAERLQHGCSSARTTRPRPGRSARPVRPTAGRPARASTSSTASWAARPTSGRRCSTTA